MRKFYTLAVAGLMGVTALAAPRHIARHAVHHEECAVKENVNLRSLYESGATNDIVKRTWTDPSTGQTWNAYIGKIGEWCNEFSTEVDLPEYDMKAGDFFPFYLMPFYKVQAEFYTADSNNDIISLLWWPSEYFFAEGDVPEAERNYDIVSINDERITSMNFEEGDEGEYWYLGDDDNPSAWLIQSSTEKSFDTTSKFGGIAVYTSMGNTLRFSAYNAESSELSFRYKGRLNPKRAGGQQRTVDLNYNGTGSVLGFDNVVYTYNIGDVLIYNTGLWGAGDDAIAEGAEESQNYEPDWGPLRRYFVAFCQEGLQYPAFTKDKIVFIPDVKGAALSTARFGYGAAYAPSEATAPYGKYILYDLSDFGGISLYAPNEYGLVPSQYNYDFCDEDGMYMIKDGETRWQTKGSELGIGDKNIGFYYDGKDTYGNGFRFSYTGKIKFFNDPTDYSKYVEIDALADLPLSGIENVVEEASPAKVSAANGQITVVADADANVAVYTIAGQVVENASVKAGETLAIDAVAGIYVVKVGDKAVKVAL